MHERKIIKNWLVIVGSCWNMYVYFSTSLFGNRRVGWEPRNAMHHKMHVSPSISLGCHTVRLAVYIFFAVLTNLRGYD